MASYKIILTRSAAKEIEGISAIKRRRLIVDRIASLEVDPRPPGCIKLTGEESYRIRQGEYRIVYRIEDEVLIVTVVKVGHRRDVYKR